MKFTVSYTMDGVGYCRTVNAANEEKAKAACEEELKAAYPSFVFVVTTVEKVEKSKEEKEEKP